MPVQLFVILPPDLDPARLAPVLAEVQVAAILIPRLKQAENAYKDRVRTIVPLAQAAGCAALIEGSRGGSGRWEPTVFTSPVLSMPWSRRWISSSRT